MPAGEYKAMAKVGVVAVVAVLIFAYFSPWFRGFLNTGGKLPPPLDTQAK
jgi:hypothetical protein